MSNYAYTIEDLLEIIAGLKQASKISVLPSDSTIINSIARQVFKGTALTDRQYNLMIEKLQSYKDQFTALDYDFDQAIKNLRLPIREIDRSKTIKIVESIKAFASNESFKNNWKWIEVKFPFSKKYIVLVESFVNNARQQYYHEKGSHTHYFKLTEKNVDLIVDNFKEKGFLIDKELLDFYKDIQTIKSEGEKSYLSYYENNKSHNLKNTAIEYFADKQYNLMQMHDRKLRHGFWEVLPSIDFTGLENIVIKRSNPIVNIDPDDYSVDSIFNLLHKLDRYPLLVCLDEAEAYTQIQKVYNSLNNIIPNKEQSVLFRVDSNSSEANFNSFVSENNLNNWLDHNTKIVYIGKNKIPKILLKEKWKPICVFSLNSNRFNSTLNDYVLDNADLLIYYDKEKYSLRNLTRYVPY